MTFAIGLFTTLPGVRMFCLYTAVQVVFTYIYQVVYHIEPTYIQLTFFSPVLSWAAEQEEKGAHCWPCLKAVDATSTDSKWKLLLMGGTISREKGKIFHEKKLQKKEPQGKISVFFKNLENKLDHQEQEGLKKEHEDTFVNKLFREIIGPFILEPTTQVSVQISKEFSSGVCTSSLCDLPRFGNLWMFKYP